MNDDDNNTVSRHVVARQMQPGLEFQLSHSNIMLIDTKGDFKCTLIIWLIDKLFTRWVDWRSVSPR